MQRSIRLLRFGSGTFICLLPSCTPSRWHWIHNIERSWLRLGTIGPACSISSRTPVALSHSSLVSKTLKNSFTYCNKVLSGYLYHEVKRQALKVLSMSLGEPLNPCGNLVWVSWSLNSPWGSIYSNAKLGWLIGAKGWQNKVSFKPRTVHTYFSGGRELRRL